MRSESKESEELLRAVGALVRDSRRHRGLTQKQLAKLADVDRSFIIGIEKGKRNVSMDVIDRLARSCGFKVEITFLPAFPPDTDDSQPD